MPPSRKAQYENAFRRGNAMSRAPIINGTRKFAKPARIGTTTRKIIVVPWNVITSSYEFFVKKCSFGFASWARISNAAAAEEHERRADVQDPDALVIERDEPARHLAALPRHRIWSLGSSRHSRSLPCR